jgi:hypothetical protein
MKKNMPGFLLMELTLYVGIALFLISLIVGFTAQRIIVMRNEQQSTHRIMQVHTGLASLRRVISQFQPSIEYWKVRASKELIVAHNMQEDRGLLIDQGKLWLITGHYNIKKREWIKKHKTLALDYIKDASFALITTNKTPILIRGVHLKTSFNIISRKSLDIDFWCELGQQARVL